MSPTPPLPLTVSGMSGPTRVGPDPFAPAQLGPITLRNRVIKAATFEGATPDALVSERLIDFHTAVGRGGIGMTTVAYCAVAPEGRTERDQLYWRDEALPGMRRLTEAVHATGAKVAAQIGHAGPVANSKSTGLPSLSPSRRLNMLSMSFDKQATEDDIRRIIAQHGSAARLAQDVGFDSVEVHFGHNYFVSSFLSPKINHRTDGWGGSLTNRMRLPRMILESIREQVGTGIAVTAKMNMDDGVPGGFWLDESLEFARTLDVDGHLDALELTCGSSLLNPMYLFRGGAPIEQMAASQPPLLKAGMKAVGRFVFREYPYESLYMLQMARQFRDAVAMPLVLLGGVTDAAGIDRAMADGFDFVAMGRAVLREPDLLLKIQKDRTTEALCIHCNRCMPTIFTGTHCPLVEPGYHR